MSNNTPELSDVLLYDPGYLNPELPTGFWFCADPEDVLAVQINAGCLRASGAFLRLTAFGKHSKIKDGGSVPPGNENEIRLRRCFLWNLQKYIFPICTRTRSARSKSCAGS